MWQTIAEVNCAAQSAAAKINKYSECSTAGPKCPNCGGSHSANEKSAQDTKEKLKYSN